jgi:hypothetical protein
MRAVWSFWSKPYRCHQHSNWLSDREHLLSTILSVETARPHFDRLALSTDQAGAEALVHQLGLRFDEVTLPLDGLHNSDPDWWMLGKLVTYRGQTGPFVHIDSDAYLWNPLPSRMTSAPVLAQNPEDARKKSAWYDSEGCLRAIEAAGGWIPESWRWYDSLQNQTAACCGIFGGNDLRFIHNYADTAITVLERNRDALKSLRNKLHLNPLFEQYILSACAAFNNIRIEYLFRSFEEAMTPGAAARAGFTHLQADAKRNLSVSQRLELRVQRDHPALYERVRSIYP